MPQMSTAPRWDSPVQIIKHYSKCKYSRPIPHNTLQLFILKQGKGPIPQASFTMNYKVITLKDIGVVGNFYFISFKEVH